MPLRDDRARESIVGPLIIIFSPCTGEKKTGESESWIHPGHEDKSPGSHFPD
jgi:hypothetical protein